MSPTIRATLSVTALLLTACGGAPFVALETAPMPDSGPEEGSIAEAGGGDSSSDASGVVEPEAGGDAADAAISHDASEEDAHELVDAHDAAEVDSAPACTSKAPIVGSCGGSSLTYPTDVCLLVSTSAGSSYSNQATPSACASWCTFTCACLGNLCPSNAPIPFCSQNADGTILLQCGTT